jgi:hypothetical protein
MSTNHLRDLKEALQRGHWRVVEELPGNDSNISGIWRVARPDGSHVLHLEFDGADEAPEVRPMERSYGVSVREAPAVAAYFALAGRTWPLELERFITQLNEWAT